MIYFGEQKPFAPLHLAADIAPTNYHLFHFFDRILKRAAGTFFLNFLLIGKRYRRMELCKYLSNYQTIEKQNGRYIVQ